MVQTRKGEFHFPDRHYPTVVPLLKETGQRLEFHSIEKTAVRVACFAEALPDTITRTCCELGIAYNYMLDDGIEFLRFTAQGESQRKVVPEGHTNPPLEKLMAIVDQSARPAVKLARLEAYIRAHHEKVTPLPWDCQVIFGERYRARQLLVSA